MIVEVEVEGVGVAPVEQAGVLGMKHANMLSRGPVDTRWDGVCDNVGVSTGTHWVLPVEDADWAHLALNLAPRGGGTPAT